MKRFLALALIVLGGVLFSAQTSFAQTLCPNPVKIQSGTITDSNGDVIKTGYDKYGYNYQAHMFNGLYENYGRPTVVGTEGTENLVMKWSDNWLANVSCGGDKLARGYDAKAGTFYGSTSNDLSLGWVTNHFEGDYLGSDGELHHYTYFAKIAYDGGATCAASGGDYPCIWGLYTVIEELQNDQFGEYGSRLKFVNKLTGPGLGKY